jgi:hypothetical protein
MSRLAGEEKEGGMLNMDDDEGEKEKPIPLYCPNCEKVIGMLSLELLREAESVEVRCGLCGHWEHYLYDTSGKVTITYGEE